MLVTSEHVIKKSSSCNSLCSLFINPMSSHALLSNLESEDKIVISNKSLLVRHQSSLELEALIKENRAIVQDKTNANSFIDKLLSTNILSYNFTSSIFNSKNKACMCKPLEEYIREKNPVELKKLKMKGTAAQTEDFMHKSCKCCNSCLENNLQSQKLSVAKQGLVDDIVKVNGKEIKIVLCDRTCDKKTPYCATLEEDNVSHNSFSFKHLFRKKKKKYHETDHLECHQNPCVILYDKCIQTSCNVKSDATVTTENQLKDFVCQTEAICHRCGKVDVEKIGKGPCCKNQIDTLKMLIKMEAKQNFRQINNILQELAYQREEMKRLNDVYDSILKTLSTSGSGDRFVVSGTLDKNQMNELRKRTSCICEINKTESIVKRISCECPPDRTHSKLMKDMMNKTVYTASHASSTLNTARNNRSYSKLSLFADDIDEANEKRKYNRRPINFSPDTIQEDETTPCPIAEIFNRSIGITMSKISGKCEKSCSAIFNKNDLSNCARKSFNEGKSILKKICDFFCK